MKIGIQLYTVRETLKIVAFAAANQVEWLDYEQDYFQGDILEGCKTSHDYLMGLSWKGKS